MLSVLLSDLLSSCIIAFQDLFMLHVVTAQLFSLLHNVLLCSCTFCFLRVLVLRNNTSWNVLQCVSCYMHTSVLNGSLGPNLRNGVADVVGKVHEIQL